MNPFIDLPHILIVELGRTTGMVLTFYTIKSILHFQIFKNIFFGVSDENFGVSVENARVSGIALQ